MAMYLISFQFTQQGMQAIKESPARVEAAKRIVKSMGGEVKAFFGVLGAKMDTMFLVEAPNDEAVTRAAVAIASQGNVRTDTHRLFNEDEYRKIVTSLP
ncbi:MAG: GYD domain-containing protein [Myxococcaceae bacterium]